MYEFKEQDAYDFARHVGIMAKTKGSELHFKLCPYCKAGRNNHDKDTFAINLKTGMFKCLRSSCGVTGNMLTLAKDFDFSLGNDVDEYYKPKKQFRTLPTPKEPIKPKSAAVKYLESRKISESIAEKYQITTQKDNDNVLVFPFYDENAELQFVKYRKIDFDKEKDKNKEWCEAKCKPILFGMMQCSDKFETLVVNEGQADSLAVATAYDGDIDVVSVPIGCKGMTFFPYCWDWLSKFEKMIIFGDCENGKITLLDEFRQRFGNKVYSVRKEDYKDCKDANEILIKYGSEQIKECINNAESLPIRQVIDLSEVEDVDIFKIPKLKTGFTEIDRLLYGGLPFGGVALVSGKPGQGKSTLASQLIVEAVEQNHKCFAYSGELPNYLFKAWLDFQIAGSSHIFDYQNQWGDRNYQVSNANKELIGNWYKGNIFLYDNRSIEGDETESLISITEKVILQYGVDVILWDNLMTAIDLEVIEGSDKYEKQSQFMKKAARLALRHNVLILLVAHKRKNNVTMNENDEVAGSSDIANLATITIAYEKNNEIEEGQRLCKISKNRLFGKTYTKGYVMNYDERSKRIYTTEGQRVKEYGWCIDKNGFAKVDEPTPFD